jgi:hypothetical protein
MARHKAFGYGPRPREWVIEAPEGRIVLRHEPGERPGYPGVLSVSIEANGTRFTGEPATYAVANGTRAEHMLVQLRAVKCSRPGCERAHGPLSGASFGCPVHGIVEGL